MENNPQQFRNAALMVIGFFVLAAFVTGELILLLVAFVPPVLFLLLGNNAGIEWDKINWLPKPPDANSDDHGASQSSNPFHLKTTNPKYETAVKRVQTKLAEADVQFQPVPQSQRDEETDVMIAQANAILDQNPKQAEAYLQRAGGYAGKRQWNDALPDINLALYHNPNLAHAHVLRGNVMMARHDLVGAVQEWDRALKLSDKLAVAYTNRGYVKATLGQLDAALNDVNLSVQLAPDLFSGYGSRGYVHFLRGDYEAAHQDFLQAAALDSSYPLPFAGLAILHQVRGDTAAAITIWQQLMDYDDVYHSRESFQERHMCGDEFADVAGDILAAMAEPGELPDLPTTNES